MSDAQRTASSSYEADASGPNCTLSDVVRIEAIVLGESCSWKASPFFSMSPSSHAVGVCDDANGIVGVDVAGVAKSSNPGCFTGNLNRSTST